MCDFTQYDSQSADYLALAAADAPAPRDLPPLELRRLANESGERASALAMTTLAPLVSIQHHTITTRDGVHLPARSYHPLAAGPGPLPVYMYVHGGGFLFGTPDKEDANCARVAVNARVLVFHADYRHTPEHVFPTAWDDAEDAFCWLHAHMATVGGIPERVVVGGTSAGGQLAASLALRKHAGAFGAHLPPIAGLVLMVPLLAHPDAREAQLSRLKDRTRSSYETNKDAPVLPVAFLRTLIDLLRVENGQLADVRVSPGASATEDVIGMAPTIIGVCGWDPLRDEGLLFAKLLAEAG